MFIKATKKCISRNMQNDTDILTIIKKEINRFVLQFVFEMIYEIYV